MLYKYILLYHKSSTTQEYIIYILASVIYIAKLHFIYI